MDTVGYIFLLVFLFLQVIVAYYLLIPTILFVIHLAMGGRGRSLLKRLPLRHQDDFHFTGIFTVHRDARFIEPFVDSVRKQRYRNFRIIIVADDCERGSVMVHDDRCTVIYPESPLHSKIKSIDLAVRSIGDTEDVLVIFDGDNLLHPDYFFYLNEYYKRGFHAVQTHMLSKNTGTVYARLDSIGHIYNTFVERLVKMELGLSSSILGLGISMKRKVYRDIMYKDGLGGFDKKLQSALVTNIGQIAFAREAIVYDEKVDTGSALERQRTRWLNAYFKYFGTNIRMVINGLKRGNFDLFYFGVTAVRPPIFILIISALLFSAVWLPFNQTYAMVWLSLLFTFVLTFVLIVLTQSQQKNMGSALLYLPLVFIRQIMSVLKIRTASRDFLKTEHDKIMYIDDVLANESK